jgi:alpha-ketoglutarate-dependent taurine dioxygenase
MHTFLLATVDDTGLEQGSLTYRCGDTLWASGYEVYDRLSEPYQRFLETLTFTAQQESLNRKAKAAGGTLFQGPRGSPENVGEDMSAVHPVVRTHPVTGWKSVFAVGTHIKAINDVTIKESEQLLDKIMHLIIENHDLQVRFRWQNPSDMGTFSLI